MQRGFGGRCLSRSGTERSELPDREFTLGSATLLAIFVGLVLLCGLLLRPRICGGAARHRSRSQRAAARPAADQQPSRNRRSRPKPSASAQAGGSATQPDATADQRDSSNADSTASSGAASSRGWSARGQHRQ